MVSVLAVAIEETDVRIEFLTSFKITNDARTRKVRVRSVLQHDVQYKKIMYVDKFHSNLVYVGLAQACLNE